jgi:hypothetical protein
LPKGVYIEDSRLRSNRFTKKRNALIQKLNELGAETGAYGYLYLRSYLVQFAMLILRQETRTKGDLRRFFYVTGKVYENDALMEMCQEHAQLFRDKELEEKQILTEAYIPSHSFCCIDLLIYAVIDTSLNRTNSAVYKKKTWKFVKRLTSWRWKMRILSVKLRHFRRKTRYDRPGTLIKLQKYNERLAQIRSNVADTSFGE